MALAWAGWLCDFYDLVPAGDGEFVLAIADVAGKGVPAALLSSMLQASLRTQAASISFQIDGAKRSASAETLEATTIFRFDYSKIQSVLNGSPPIASKFYRALARFLSNRLRQTTTDMSFAREKNLRHF